jgi:hypothetical protein
MLNPPANAMIPESGTKKDAIGTPALAAYPMLAAWKWCGPLKIKIAENNILPINNEYFMLFVL